MEDKSIYHKNLLPVVYVTGDVAGREESPVYAINKLGAKVADLRLPENYQIPQYGGRQPASSSQICREVGR